MEERYKREIKANFPYPIASRFAYLYTKQYKNAGYARLDNIFGTAGVITRYLAIIVISECRVHLEEHPELSGQCLPLFAQQIKRPTLGQWVGFIREGLKWLQVQQADLTMPELYNFWFNSPKKQTKAALALNTLVEMRNNKTGHNFQGLSEGEYEPLCAEIWEYLTIVLEALDFLSEYELRFIHKIEVNNIRRRPRTYIHEYSMGVGSDNQFPADDECKDDCMESEAALLLNPKRRRYLNLEPLIIYGDEGKAPDVFFYESMKSPETAHYAACKHGEFRLNAGNVKRRQYMIEELHYLLELFSATKSVPNTTL